VGATLYVYLIYLVRHKEPMMAVLSDAQHKHQLALMSAADWEKLHVLHMVLSN